MEEIKYNIESVFFVELHSLRYLQRERSPKERRSFYLVRSTVCTSSMQMMFGPTKFL